MLLQKNTLGLQDDAYPNVHGMLSVSKRMGEGLVPSWIQGFINYFAFIELFSFKFKLHVRITVTFKVEIRTIH